MSIRVVQLTDLHLFRDTAGIIAGVRSWDTFNAVLAQTKAQQKNIDYLILTGDIAQDEELETYIMLRDALGDWLDRCKIIPGNHDSPDHLREVFPEMFLDNSDALTFELFAGNWCLIGLDSHVPGQVNGRVDSEQLKWLKRKLDSHADNQTLLFIHHPPVPISVNWIDKLGLDEASELVELIASSPQIKVVCAGHVHQEFQGKIGTAEIYTTPSTCVQFGARANKTFDTKAAGYRVFNLRSDGYQTEVLRLLDS